MNKLEQYKQDKQAYDAPSFCIGDTVNVSLKIKEGNKERIQIFTGTVIALNAAKTNGSFTVRHLLQGQGVEKVFPLGSKTIQKIEVKRRGDVRRAKLYYLRDRQGKAVRVREKI